MLVLMNQKEGQSMDIAAFAPVALVTVLAALEVVVFSAMVGKARGTYDVKLPFQDGPEDFMRINRIHLNTIEQMAAFLPLLWMSAIMFKPMVAAALGLAFVIGRVIYAIGYKKSVDKRTPGFLIGFLANVGLAITALIGIVKACL